MRTRSEYEETVKGPGKFENEQPWVPYFWDVYLDGCADDDDGDSVSFVVTDEDRATFPELQDTRVVRLQEQEDGFVVEV